MSRELILSEKIIDRICKCGYKAYLCGGAVRDEFLYGEPDDYDIVTSATPEELKLMFHDRKVKSYGAKFLVTSIDGIDVATYRTEYNTGSGRFNTVTKACRTLEEDLARRDFTFNALAICPYTGEVVDLFGGRIDLNNKVVRFIGDPNKRIYDDELRMIRAARFACLIEGELEEQTFTAIVHNKDLVKNISPERIQIELLKVMKYPRPHIFFDVLWQTGLLKLILPEFNSLYGHTGGSYHSESLEEHAFLVGESLSPKDPVLRLIGYFHDIGKPFSYDYKTQSFRGHEVIGADLIEALFKRLRFSKSDIKRAKGLVLCHMKNITYNSSDKAVRRMLKALNDNGVSFKDWLLLRIADKNGNCLKENYKREQIKYIVLKAHNAKAIKKKIGFSISDLDINGYDIMKLLNIKPGKLVGEILKYLFEIVINDPTKNEKEVLLKIVKDRWYD